MANEYVTSTNLKVPLGISDSTDDTWLGIVATAASRAIDTWCGRRFYADGAATARVFHPVSSLLVLVDDIAVTTDLVIKSDPTGDASFGTTWTTADYELRPLNGVVRNRSGHPYESIWAVNNLWFPCNARASVQVTARWGWTTAPEEITQAAYLLGEDLFKRKDAPFGVAGVSDFGVLRIKQDPIVQALLAPFRRDDGVAG